jgi:glycosyltransferase involved in cell wall biosynthesis
MSICVVIPCYNEAKGIAALVGRIRGLDLDVVVVDDGSDDNTAALAKQMGAKVLRNEARQGKGASLRKGFAFALQNSFEAVITMDGDGQHDPADIPRFIIYAHGREPCMIVGNRILDARGMPLIRWLTNHFMSWIISMICGQKVLDSQNGFRFISAAVLKNITLITDNFEIESEMLIAAGKKGFKIYSVPVKTIYSDEKSRINPVVDTIRFFRFLFKGR